MSYSDKRLTVEINLGWKNLTVRKSEIYLYSYDL